MSKLDNLATFVEVARAGSFSAAARQLQVPRSTISFRIASLEGTLSVRLLKRSTRAVSLTEEGRELYQSAAGALASLNASLDQIGHPAGHLKGVIRIAAPSDLPQAPLVEAVGSFRQANPDVRFEIRLTNELLDLVKDNIDVAIRLGEEDGADVVRRRLLEFPCGFFAHRTWIDLYGEPRDPTEARDLLYPSRRARGLLDGSALPSPGVDVNSFAMIRSMVLRSCGVGFLPKEMVRDDLQSGTLVQVLENIILPPLRMHLSFATRADITPRVRAFADHLSLYL